MSKKRLPDSQEALAGVRVATATARAHLTAADILAEREFYGQAAALAVLAYEESVKARALAAIAVAGNRVALVEDTLVQIIYSGHKARHVAGLVQHLAAAHPNIYGTLVLGGTLTVTQMTDMTTLADMVDSANSLKQSGFSPTSIRIQANGRLRPASADRNSRASGTPLPNIWTKPNVRRPISQCRLKGQEGRLAWNGRCGASPMTSPDHRRLPTGISAGQYERRAQAR